MRITKRTRSTVRKIVASLGVLGVAAAVAGLGTYGSFTDSATPVSTGIGTAVLDLALDQPAGAAAIPVSTSNFLPGDSLTRALDLNNAGGARLSSVTLGVTAGPPTSSPRTRARDSSSPSAGARSPGCRHPLRPGPPTAALARSRRC